MATYKNYYMQASEMADKIARGEVTSVARDNEGLVRKSIKPIEEDSQQKMQSMVLDYFQAIDNIPTRPKARPEIDLAPSESKRPPMKGYVPVEDDVTMLALTLEAEAGNQGFEGMLDVGSVVMNRLQDDRYGNTLSEVIMQPGQFSAWNSVTGYAGGEQGQNMARQPSKESVAAAKKIIQGEYEDRTGGATHYYAIIPGVSDKPKWSNENFKQIGDHYFGNA